MVVREKVGAPLCFREKKSHYVRQNGNLDTSFKTYRNE